MERTFEPGSQEIFIHKVLAPLMLRWFYEPFVQKLALKGNEKVIDFGSGSGLGAQCLAEALPNGKLTCIDISNRWIAEARKRLKKFNNTQLIQGYVSNLNLAEDSFDLIVFHLVLHDIPAHQRKEILRILVQAIRPGGKIVFREPMKEGHGISAEELHRLMTSCGLKRRSLTTPRIRFIGNVAEGIYMKEKL